MHKLLSLSLFGRILSSAYITLALTFAFAVATPSHAQVVKTQSQLISLFEKACLNTFPNTERVDQFAQKRNFEQINETQWSAANTATNIAVFRLKNKGKRVNLKGELFEDVAWNNIGIPLNEHANRKRNQAGCAVMAVNVPIDQMGQKLIPILSKYADQPLKTRSQGLLFKSEGLIGGEKFINVVRLLKLNSANHAALISIIKAKAN